VGSSDAGDESGSELSVDYEKKKCKAMAFIEFERLLQKKMPFFNLYQDDPDHYLTEYKDFVTESFGQEDHLG